MCNFERFVCVLLAGIAFSAGARTETKDIEATYNKSCVVCHAAAVAGAPKTGDAAAWKPRLDKGMDALLVSVEKGLNAMPPKGMCMDCTEQDYAALIEYMASPK